MFEDFLKSSSPADYAKMLIKIENSDENKEIVAKIKDRTSYLKDRKKEMNDKEKKCKNADETLKILKKFLITIKMLKNIFSLHQKLIKENEI